MHKVALGLVFSEYFGFPCQFSFQYLLHIHYPFDHRRYIVSILIASLNNKKSFFYLSSSSSLLIPFS
jgi:hypothetical protein